MSVPASNVCIDEDEQPIKIDESDKAKNERFHQEVCNKLTCVFPDLCFVKAHDN